MGLMPTKSFIALNIRASMTDKWRVRKRGDVKMLGLIPVGALEGRRRYPRLEGIGLVEVLVTAFILSILVIASLRVTGASTKTVSESSNSLAATLILSSAIELGYYTADQASWSTRIDNLNLVRPSTEFTVSDFVITETGFTSASEAVILSPSRLTGAGNDSRRLRGATINASAVGSVAEINRLTAEAASSDD